MLIQAHLPPHPSHAVLWDPDGDSSARVSWQHHCVPSPTDELYTGLFSTKVNNEFNTRYYTSLSSELMPCWQGCRLRTPASCGAGMNSPDMVSSPVSCP